MGQHASSETTIDRARSDKINIRDRTRNVRPSPSTLVRERRNHRSSLGLKRTGMCISTFLLAARLDCAWRTESFFHMNTEWVHKGAHGLKLCNLNMHKEDNLSRPLNLSGKSRIERIALLRDGLRDELDAIFGYEVST
eukprot:m.385050 g.385050  ORF g.385050 m.385050 type:complete len:138 (+) comp16737_c2_seq7:571-984(+)